MMGSLVDDEIAIRERLVRLETKVELLTTQTAEVKKNTDDLVAIMQQAKGAKWILLIAASVGGFLATKLASFAGIFPR